MRTTATWLVGLLVAGAVGLTPSGTSAAQEPRSQPRNAEPAQPVVGSPDTPPEAALRAFLLAMVARDEPAMHDLSLPNAGFEWLLKGERLTSDQMAAARTAIGGQEIRTLHPGDTVRLRNGQDLVIRPDEVSATRAVLLPEGAPIPTRLRQVEGKWKVDAGALIAARKAADAARKQAEKMRTPAEKAQRAAEALRQKAAEDAQGRAAEPTGPEP